MYRTRLLIPIIALLGALSSGAHANFTDDFSTDTSANYRYTDTYGSGGSFNISGGTLNLTNAPANTANAFHQTAELAAGDCARVTVPAGTPYDFYLTVSTTTRGPNTGTEDGIRFQVRNNSTLRARTYRDGVSTFTEYPWDGTAWTGDLELLIFRDSNSEYRVGYDLGSGPVLFGPITINQTAATTGLYIGVEGYYGSTTTRSFDHLEILPISQLPCASASFCDHFSTDTSANYRYTDTYGSGGSFEISGGTLNLTNAPANTANAFHRTAQLTAGHCVRVSVPAGTPYDFSLTVSTTTRGPKPALRTAFVGRS